MALKAQADQSTEMSHPESVFTQHGLFELHHKKSRFTRGVASRGQIIGFFLSDQSLYCPHETAMNNMLSLCFLFYLSTG